MTLNSLLVISVSPYCLREKSKPSKKCRQVDSTALGSSVYCWYNSSIAFKSALPRNESLSICSMKFNFFLVTNERFQCLFPKTKRKAAPYETAFHKIEKFFYRL